MSKKDKQMTGTETDLADSEALNLVILAAQTEETRDNAEDTVVSFAARVFNLAVKTKANAETWGKMKTRIQAFFRSTQGQTVLEQHHIILEKTEKGECKLPRIFIQYWSNVAGGLKLGLNPTDFENEIEYRRATQDARVVNKAEVAESEEKILLATMSAEQASTYVIFQDTRTQVMNDLKIVASGVGSLGTADVDTLSLIADCVREAASMSEQVLARVKAAQELEATEAKTAERKAA